MILNSINSLLREMTALLHQLSDEDYSCGCRELSGATIGEHTRHIIEMFQCLAGQYDSGVINYDKRERNLLIQTSTDFAVSAIHDLELSLNKTNKPLKLNQQLCDQDVMVESNYERELLYNLEHCIHHQALIKVALLDLEAIQIADTFGVAASTIAYRTCVQ
ncbi:MAG: DinB family protein [Flavobacterium sp.]|nr:MAG: DinB family protein [Flavobacterium sp.]